MSDKLLSLLGLCRRAGKIVIGNDPVIDSIVNKKASLVLLAADTSQNTTKKILSISHQYNMRVEVLSYTKDEISIAVGKYCTVLSVCDKGFADKVYTLIPADKTKEE